MTFIQLCEITGLAEHHFGVAREAVKRTVMELVQELVCDDLMPDWDANGRLLGFEILSASRILDPELLSTAVPPGSPPPDIDIRN